MTTSPLRPLLLVISLILALVAVSACTSSTTMSPKDQAHSQKNKAKSALFKPDWVSDGKRGAGAIYGVGSAEIYGNDLARARKRANDDALLDLVGQLKIEVAGSTSKSITETRSNNASSFTKTLSHQASTKISPVELFDVEQADVWHDESGKRIYVLAFLNRNKAALNISQDIEKIEAKLQGFNSKPISGDTLQDLRNLLPALPLIAEQETLFKRYRLIAGKNLNSPEKPASVSIEENISTLFGQLKVSVSPLKKASKKLESGLTRNLNKLGISVSQTNQAVDLAVKYTLEQEVVTEGDTYFALSSAQTQFLSDSDQILLDVRHNAKAASSILSKAQARSIDKLATAISKDFSDFFAQQFESQ